MAGDILARLLGQAEEEGAGLITLRALAEEAGEVAVERALERLGLADRNAIHDIRELRDLLQAWRDARATVRRTTLGWLVRLILPLILMLLAVRFGFADRLTLP